MVVISVVGAGAVVHATNVENKDILQENAHQMKIITEIEVFNSVFTLPPSQV